MTLHIEKLGEMIVERRGTLGIRAAAKEIGISPATLSRIENGNVPDLATFAAICQWLGKDPNQFLGMQPAKPGDEAPTVHLRKKKTTSVDTATALGGLILAAQEALRDIENL
ncbi:helix-turn-helix domain-containing protein [Hoeflea poritis]|uniref:Helix-turn-helix transcriptional regulator n=1 Tax=Hoeflea poritis TaxID=2993659 RepID=A0ABT4VVG3_9HYPH|nr:helix-turn-helix transcriptional regulator [Hoeflea poritis]MDA4848619.1 helix-turn-helix transcriptional regulator [Hoeflea poritis]